MEYDTVDKIKFAFFRLVATETDDPDLTNLGEGTDDVFELNATEGCRDAQRYMLDMGYGGWHKRTSALTWTGADDTDGGRYLTLPTDFLRAYGTDRASCLVEANGNGWGTEINHRMHGQHGQFFYFRGDRLWITRSATPPTTLYLEYHYLHPKWESLADDAIDFPLDARRLIVACAANVAKEDNWFPLDAAGELKIERNLQRAKVRARGVARLTKTPRRFMAARRVGNHW